MTQSELAPKEGPRGLGGWLILPAIGLVISPLSILYTLYRSYLPIFQLGYWQQLTRPGTAAYHPLWAPLLIFEVAVNLAWVAFLAVLLYLFFTKSYRLPRLFIAYLVSRIVFLVADTLLVGLIPTVADQLDWGAIVRSTGTAVGAAAIWIPYFLTSKRVKNTFVEGRPGSALQLVPDMSAEAQQHLELAHSYEARDEFEPALSECELAIQLAPDLAEAHNLRGIILESLGRGPEAVEAYREAARLDPMLVEARQNLEEAEAEFGKVEQGGQA